MRYALLLLAVLFAFASTPVQAQQSSWPGMSTSANSGIYVANCYQYQYEAHPDSQTSHPNTISINDQAGDIVEMSIYVYLVTWDSVTDEETRVDVTDDQDIDWSFQTNPEKSDLRIHTQELEPGADEEQWYEFEYVHDITSPFGYADIILFSRRAFGL